MTLEPSSPLPLYHQLERVLAERIVEGRYRDGFPGDHELAGEFSVSRGTVRQALERLARSGLIVRHQGRGSFVAAPLEYPLGRFYHFAHDMQVRGIPESSEVLARGVVRAPAPVAAALGLARGDRVLRIVRLRMAGERPVEHRLVLAPGDRVTLTASWGNLG